MTTSTVKLLGYDRDGDKVYIDETTGRVGQWDSIRDARRYFLDDGGCDRVAYETMFGPITARKKR